MTASVPRPLPFPWEALDTVTRAEAGALRDARRWLARHARPHAIGGACRDLLDAEIEVRVGRIQPADAHPAAADDVGVLIAGADSGAYPVLVESEKALAARVVARALKRPEPVLLNDQPEPLSRVAGALAAVLMAVLRRAHAGVATRVLGAGPAREMASEALDRLGSDPWALSLTVLLENDAYAARVVLSSAALLSCPAPPWNGLTLAALGPTPLVVPIVAAVTRMTRTDVESLRPGDAIVPRPGERIWPTARVAHANVPVWLSPPSSELGVRGHLALDGRLVLTGELESLVDAEAPMDPDANAALVSVLADCPVVVRVEIGEAQMSARDWATVGRGDVIPLGRRVGEPVVLRVAGVCVARGELVQIDGEVAVRVVERLPAEGAAL
ncbi:MAG TPA: FliM/FliN family flagellar motor switch protein [Polyangiaceae bacterium]|jgi:flagellar motor switch/type III secretory pathway protein FliN